ncbi:outer membrane efflux protein [Bacteriovorax sp. BAL6_X]|uniref:TolC family protein n=1 Tax=Bacteriovorax sp. BAL6_X TaxID=1201290 RepID=UPI00038612DB|nr:TolC family protein [Bacteriovorax sp. BAL6_X]EPZ50181.1 outer membrane efflux protein [Bacteriovorax sp. BAL6_X]
MNYYKIAFLIVTFTPFICSASVEELYLKSLKKSKQVEVFKLTEKKTVSDLETVESSLYPSLDAVYANTYRDEYPESSKNKEIDSEVYLSLRQKLFQGGAEFALYDYNKIVPKQAKALTDKSLAEYYSQFSTLFFQMSSAIEEKERVEALLKNLKKRVSIVRQRAKIGRDRKADLYALESQLHRLEAGLVQSKAQVKTSMTDFMNFSGLDDVKEVKDSIDPLKLILSKNVDLENTPDLKSLKYDYEASVAEAKIEKAAYYPQVDLSADYNIDKNDIGERDWRVSLNVTLNLLDFGERKSKVTSRRIVSQINKAQIDYNRRNTVNRWSAFVKNFDYKKNELQTLRKALYRSRASYQEQLKDLNKGLVTQIEVIRSLDDVIDLEKLAIRSSLEVKSLYYQANAYLGNIPKN